MSDEPQQVDMNAPMSLPGEAQFAFGIAEIAPGVKLVMLTVASGNGVTVQVAIRPALALTVAKLLSDQAKLAKSGLVIAGNGDIPKPLEAL